MSKYKLSNYNKSKNIVFGSNFNSFTFFQKFVDETQYTCMQLAKTNLIQKLTKKKSSKSKLVKRNTFFAEYDNIVPVITIKMKKEEQKNNKIMLQK